MIELFFEVLTKNLINGMIIWAAKLNISTFSVLFLQMQPISTCKYILYTIYRQHAYQCSINKTSKTWLYLVCISMPNQAPCLWFSIHRDVTVTSLSVARCRRLKRQIFCVLQSYIQLSISHKMSPQRLKDMWQVHLCVKRCSTDLVLIFLYGL